MFKAGDRVIYNPAGGPGPSFRSARSGEVVQAVSQNGTVDVVWDGESCTRRHGSKYLLPGRPSENKKKKKNDGARFESTLPNGSKERKEYPLYEVLFGQFPAAMTAIAHHSHKGNAKHNPGLPLQDNRALSKDDGNCILRHLMEGDYEGVAWRAVRLLQKKLEQEGAPVAPLATNAEGNY